MHIKRFKGRTVKEAIRYVKEELGENALIIDTRRASGGYVEILAVVERDAEEKKAVKSQREAHLLKELRELKEFVLCVMKDGKRQVARVFTSLEDELVKEGLDRRLARNLIFKAFSSMREREPDTGWLKRYIKKKLLDSVNTTDPLSSRSRTFMAFVGPTGAGKTSTIAKLASLEALKGRKKIALFTMDTQRAGAAEQLTLYGKIIGVPVQRVDSVEELLRAVDMHTDKDCIFVDTAGRSLTDTEHIRSLAELSRAIPYMKLNLVMSVQSQNEFLYETIDHYKKAGIDYLTFTKLDEGGLFGAVFNAALYSRKPLTYFTTGQHIPNDIERVTLKRLSTMILNNTGGTDGTL